MCAMAQHRHARQHRGHDGDRHDDVAGEGIVSGMRGVLRMFDMVFGSVLGISSEVPCQRIVVGQAGGSVDGLAAMWVLDVVRRACRILATPRASVARKEEYTWRDSNPQPTAP